MDKVNQKIIIITDACEAAIKATNSFKTRNRALVSFGIVQSEWMHRIITWYAMTATTKLAFDVYRYVT